MIEIVVNKYNSDLGHGIFGHKCSSDLEEENLKRVSAQIENYNSFTKSSDPNKKSFESLKMFRNFLKIFNQSWTKLKNGKLKIRNWKLPTLNLEWKSI